MFKDLEQKAIIEPHPDLLLAKSDYIKSEVYHRDKGDYPVSEPHYSPYRQKVLK